MFMSGNCGIKTPNQYLQQETTIKAKFNISHLRQSRAKSAELQEQIDY
jgi:hypothetical protein